MTTVPEPLDVLTLGETMALLVAQEPGPLEQVQTFSKRLAGADSNVAIGLARGAGVGGAHGQGAVALQNEKFLLGFVHGQKHGRQIVVIADAGVPAVGHGRTRHKQGAGQQHGRGRALQLIQKMTVNQPHKQATLCG